MEEDNCESILKHKNYYDILGINKKSTTEEIRKAYKKLAVKYHPDKNKSPHAADAFKKISQAFSVLSDPVKKQNYDNYGDEEGIGSHGTHSFTTNFHGGVDPFDLFESMFGGGFGFHNSNSFSGFKVYSSSDGTMYFSSSGGKQTQRNRRGHSHYDNDDEEEINTTRRRQSNDVFSDLFEQMNQGHTRQRQNRRNEETEHHAKNVFKNIQLCIQLVPILCFIIVFLLPYLLSFGSRR